jgi:hypothetical protein
MLGAEPGRRVQQRVVQQQRVVDARAIWGRRKGRPEHAVSVQHMGHAPVSGADEHVRIVGDMARMCKLPCR